MSVLDELQFGPERTLDLHQSLPSATEAVRLAENFLREHQVRGSSEVLVVTGRGSHSPDGIAVLHPAIEKLLFALRRAGVVASHHDHNPGAFVVRLAPIRSVVESIPRQKDRRRPRGAVPAIHGLGADANRLLRDLAERSLDALGVRHSEAALEDEMHRQLRAIAPGLPGGQEMEAELERVLRRAIAEYD